MLDAVVGVFLTQNVSDALSSKAWMTLAAAFPLRARRAAAPRSGIGLGACPPDEAADAAGLLPAPQPQGANPAAGGAAQAAGEEAGGCGSGGASGASAGSSWDVQGRGALRASGVPGSEAGRELCSKQAAAGVQGAHPEAAAAQPGSVQPGPPLPPTPLSPVRPTGLEGGGGGAAQQPATPPIREQAKAGAGRRSPAAGTGSSTAPGLHSPEAAALCDSRARGTAGARELPPVAGAGLKLETSGAALMGARGLPAAGGNGAGLQGEGGCGGGGPAGGQAWELVGADAEGGDFGDSIDWEAVRTAPMEKVWRPWGNQVV